MAREGAAVAGEQTASAGIPGRHQGRKRPLGVIINPGGQGASPWYQQGCGLGTQVGDRLGGPGRRQGGGEGRGQGVTSNLLAEADQSLLSVLSPLPRASLPCHQQREGTSNPGRWQGCSPPPRWRGCRPGGESSEPRLLCPIHLLLPPPPPPPVAMSWEPLEGELNGLAPGQTPGGARGHLGQVPCPRADPCPATTQTLTGQNESPFP